MKSSRLVLFLVLLFFGLAITNAQEGSVFCGFNDEAESPLPFTFTGSIDPDYLADFPPIVFSIKFWGVNRPDTTNDFPNRKEESLQAVANLNKAFNQYNIFFKYRGYNEFNSPEVDGDPLGHYVLQTTAEYGQLRSYAVSNGYVDNNAFNVYIYGWGSFGGISPGLSTTFSGVSSGNLGGPIFVHEIGHNLSLRHTRSTNERVTRDPEDPMFNALTTGDLLVDTAANSGFLPLEDYPYINFPECTYNSGFEFDTSDPPRAYEITHEDVINLLGNCYPCMEIFTTVGQGIRMREAILSGAYDAAVTTIESLYEPYTGVYRTCCWSELDEDRPPLFQPGFDYEFVYCEDEITPSGGRTEPWPYSDLTFNTGDVVYSFDKDIDISDFYKIKHLNGTAVKIKQIDDSQARRCYSNLAKNAVSGVVVKFNDGVINSNYSVTPKDSTQINNPDLIMQLDQGLYLIETNFDDGSQDQNVILKENDNNECP